MSVPENGYYFMFEIGWFIDLLIPTLVRVKNGNLFFVGSKPCNAKDVKPCCIPAGGTEECKKIALDDASLKAFKCIDSLVRISNPDDMERELTKSLAEQDIRDLYFNTPSRLQREATIQRITNDYHVLAAIEH